MAANVIETIDGLHAQITNKIDGRLELNLFLIHDDDDHVMIIAIGLLNVVRVQILLENQPRPSPGERKTTYIGPRHKIIRSLHETTHERMLHNLVRDVEVICILDECEAEFAPARITPKGDVGLEIRDLFGVAV